jgi:ribulose-phosphate 3-epimerase
MSPRDRILALRSEKAVILPSLLMCDFGNLEREIRALEESGVQALHLDVMDGVFVPNLSYGLPVVEAIRRLTDLPIDVHLMIQKPSQYLKAFIETGVDCITFHIEAEPEPRPLLEELTRAEVASGLVLNPQTPLDTVQPYLSSCDLLLVMSVNAGFGGQAFNPVALEKLKTVRESFPDNLILEIDGGINLETVASSVQAGAQWLVVGSAIFKMDNYQAAIQQLMQEALGSPP